MLTETKQDPFIGQRFGEHGQIVVLGRSGKKCKSTSYYNVLCEICSQDQELFGDGVFECLASNLKKGSLPCGCSKTPQWSRSQIILRLQRACASRGIGILRIPEIWNGTKTVVQLKCPTYGTTWTSTIASVIRKLTDSCGCLKCRGTRAGISKLLSVEEAAIKFLSYGTFPPGTSFRRSDAKDHNGYNKFWITYCPICDEEFESQYTNLSKGARPCNCHKNSFAHENDAAFYVLKVLGGIDFVGYGISNNVYNRIRAHKNVLKKRDQVIDEMEIFYTTGRNALMIEREVRAKFEVYSQPISGFITEATLPYLYDDVIRFVEEILSAQRNTE